MAKTYKINVLGAKPKSDTGVEYSPTDSPLKITINSKVKSYFGKSLHQLCKQVCGDLDVKTGHLHLNDFGALPFVIMAKIEAVIKLVNPDIVKQSLPEMKSHCLYSSTRDRFRRSRLYIPGNQPKLMLNAGIHGPDGIILDLEDAVAPGEKTNTRFVVRNALRTLDFFGAERMVRINQGSMGLKDLEYLVPHNVHLILIPKVESGEQVVKVNNRIQEISNNCGRKDPVFLLPIIESGRGVLKALEIAEATKNIVALAIGLEDYTADLGTQRTEEGRESFFARSMIVNAARAAGIQAIDTVFSDVDDEAALRASVKEAKMLGFDGKGCIHPRQIRPIHEEFSPTDSEIEKAKKIVFAFEEAESRGLGVVSLGSKMIDPPVVKRACQTIESAVSMGLLPKNWKELNQ